MEHDYYAILGVAETADRAEIWRAYRRLAYEHHPDRGGTHAHMVLLNKAWEMLGNPERRRHYDQVRRAPSDLAAQSEWRRDEAAAQETAERYPTEWAALEKWWQSVAREFTDTDYGRWLFDMENVRGSSLGIFIGIGALLGFIAGVCLALNIDYPKPGKAALHRLVGAIGVPTFIGMLSGKLLHYLLTCLIRLGGTGNSRRGIGLTEGEWRRIGTSAVLGVIAFLTIADNSEPKLTGGMTQAAVRTAFDELIDGKLKSGLVRGGILGAVACFILANYELAKNVGRVRHDKLPEYFPFRAALYGGLALAAAGFVFEFLSVPKSSGGVVFWRMVTGGIAGAAASVFTLLTIKQTTLPQEAGAKAEDYAADPILVPCVHCGKKLRVPLRSEELWVTCPACSGRFAFGGSDSDSAR